MIYGRTRLTVMKTVSGAFADPTKDFTFTLSWLNGSSYRYVKYTTADGSTWARTSYGTLTPSNGQITFTLHHNEKIDINVPINTSVTVTETNEMYTPTYKVDGGTAASGSSVSVTLNSSKTVAFDNYLPPVAPTAYHADPLPYLLLLCAGTLLLLVSRRKRGGGAHG